MSVSYGTMSAMPTLDDLPPYRRAKLLWQYAHLGVWWIEEMVRERAGEPCSLSGVPKPSVPRVAVLGGDGWYHLMSDGRMICAEGRTGQGWEHKQRCGWTEIAGGVVDGYGPWGGIGPGFGGSQALQPSERRNGQ